MSALWRPIFSKLGRPLASAVTDVLGGGNLAPDTKLGPELLTNGDFASATGWTAGGGWSIGSGVASAASSGTLSRNITVNPGDAYMVAYDMTARTAGQVTPNFSIGTTVNGAPSNAVGGKRTIITAATGNATFGMTAAGSPVLSIDNTSVKKILSGGFLTALGDSLTLWVQYGLTEPNYYPYLLQTAMPHVAANNLGVSGNTTGNMVARLSSITVAPYIAIFYGGTNDASGDTTVAASPAPTTTTFSVAAGKGVRYGAGCKILVNGVQCEVLSVATDAITLSAALGAPPTAGQTVTLDTTGNLVKMGQYVQTMGTTRVLIVGRHFDNFASGTGDTLAAQNVVNASIRTRAAAAASTLGAVYVDVYAHMRALIVAGTYAEGNDTAWHVGVGDLHLSATGQQILTDAIYARIVNRGWQYA